MQRRRLGVLAVIVINTLLYVGLAHVAVTAAGCAGRDALLSKTLAGVNAARDGFAPYDKDHQAEIVEAAKTREEGVAALSDYRAKRNKVTVAFVAAYGAIAAASVDLTDESLTKAAFAARDLVSALRALGVIK